tara:strand:+ start:639 stop:881 length:243 start_codon:yes stop_codon:yes gene_type:complete
MTIVNHSDAFDDLDDLQCEDFYPDPDPDEDEDEEWPEYDPYEDEPYVSGEDAIEFFDESGGLTAEALAFLAEEDSNGRFI